MVAKKIQLKARLLESPSRASETTDRASRQFLVRGSACPEIGSHLAEANVILIERESVYENWL
jgi:hypothetical protein